MKALLTALNYIITIAYVAGIVYLMAFNGPFQTGYLIALVWFVLYVLVDKTNDNLRRTIRANMKREIVDFMKFGKDVIKLTTELAETLTAAYDKKESAMKQRIWELEGTIKVYERNEKDRTQKKRRR